MLEQEDNERATVIGPGKVLQNGKTVNLSQR
jgi:hypothetical protein